MIHSQINFNQNQIRTIVIDDRKLIRETVQVYLEAETDLEIVGYADSGFAGLEQIKKLAPDVAIVDLEMPDMDGIAAIEIICQHFPSTKVLVLSGHEEPEYINDSIKAGAKGYLLKGTSPHDLADGIRYVSKGYFHLGPGLLEKLTLSSLDKSIKESKNSQQKLNKSLQQQKWELINECKSLIDTGLEHTYKELTDAIELKLYALRSKQIDSLTKLKKLQQRSNLLSISSLLLWLIMLGYMMIDNIP